MKPGPIILAGGGGHCRAVIDVLESSGWSIAGLVNPVPAEGLGYPYLGDDGSLAELRSRFDQALVAVGQIKSPAVRQKLFTRLKDLDYHLPSPVASTARLSPRASLGEGSLMMHMAVVNAGARVGRNCIINTRALVEHDAQVGDHCHISLGAIVAGGAEIGDEVFMGLGSLCREGVKIGRGCIVGLGAKVLKDLPPGTVHLGEK